MRLASLVYSAAGFWFLTAPELLAEPLRWSEIPGAVRAILAEGSLTSASYAEWQRRRTESLGKRLAAGSAEHIAYFLLQSRVFTEAPALDPAMEARRYFDSLSAGQRTGFLSGKSAGAGLRDEVHRRIDGFWGTEPTGERHRVLLGMAAKLGWDREQIVESAFRFLIQRSQEGDADQLYQRRGLSADPYPLSMRAVQLGLRRTPPNAEAVLIAGPGAELGSRFGVDDAAPVASPQPGALIGMLGRKPARFDCIDVRPEVVESLSGGPCKAMRFDLAGEALPEEAYDLAVATNVLVYLTDTELALALVNMARALRPGGCLLHNDSRFAARLFGEAAGIPVTHYESVRLGQRGEREQLDRVVVHCRAVARPD